MSFGTVNPFRSMAACAPLRRTKEGIVTAAVGSMHEALLERKAYGDLSTNHVNHPNDFLIRIHAQVILSALIGFSESGIKGM